VIHVHHDSLAQARNAALAEVESEFVIHLDADDELEPGYIEAMSRGSADIRAPSVRRVYPRYGIPEDTAVVPKVWSHEHSCTGECLRAGNWIVIGACARTELVRNIGWEEFGWSEDWAMWARAWKAGATFETISEAVYRAYHNRRGRNRVGRAKALRWHREIELAIWGESHI
jgi:glycosyltransferase involved in cell wall biosynthesis